MFTLSEHLHPWKIHNSLVRRSVHATSHTNQSVPLIGAESNWCVTPTSSIAAGGTYKDARFDSKILLNEEPVLI